MPQCTRESDSLEQYSSNIWGQQWAISQCPGWRRDWLFPVLSNTSSKSHLINLLAATFKTNKRKSCCYHPAGRLWLQEVWWDSNGGCRSTSKILSVVREATAGSGNTHGWGSFKRELFYRIAFIVPKPSAFGHCWRQDNGLAGLWSVPCQPHFSPRKTVKSYQLQLAAAGRFPRLQLNCCVQQLH